MIHFGARFTPCMHNVQDITDATSPINWPCPNTTSSDSSTYTCTLSDLCGFGGIPEPKYDSTASMSDSPEPNQWWRFIIPMFMHAGLIHIGFNLLLQLTMGREIEKSIGSIRFFLVYVSAAIFGFVLGGNYASSGSPSTGASGGLFGIIALNLLDLFYSWSDRVSPLKDLLFIMLDIVISFVLGLLPGVDNFSHIGGLLMGLTMGLSVLHSPNALRRRIGEDDAPYSTVNAAYSRDTPPGFVKNPVGFFKGRKPLWWAWWLIRAGALLLVFIVFILLLRNFYVFHVTCSWCKYLSCLVSLPTLSYPCLCKLWLTLVCLVARQKLVRQRTHLHKHHHETGSYPSRHRETHSSTRGVFGLTELRIDTRFMPRTSLGFWCLSSTFLLSSITSLAGTSCSGVEGEATFSWVMTKRMSF